MVTEGIESRTRPTSRRTESLRSDSLNVKIKIGGSSDCGEMELNDDYIIAIESIQAHGINASDIARLRAHGVVTVYVKLISQKQLASASVGPFADNLMLQELLRRMKKDLEKIKGFSDVKVEKIKEAGKKMMPNFNGFITATEHGQARKRCIRISTGSKQLDSILNGGFETQSISEVYGEFRCGKTQLGHTMAVIAQLPTDIGGAEGKVAYIDTEGTFRPERIAEIAARFGVDPEQACENISFARCMNSEHQYELLDSLAPSFATGEYKLLVIDSVMGCFRTDYQGRGELSERQQKLGQYLDKVKAMAEQFNLAVLMTNQVQSDPGASALFASADGRKPVGGHVLAHASTTRILLRKGRGEERVAKIIDSPDCAEREATYIITSGGINDPERA